MFRFWQVIYILVGGPPTQSMRPFLRLPTCLFHECFAFASSSCNRRAQNSFTRVWFFRLYSKPFYRFFFLFCMVRCPVLSKNLYPPFFFLLFFRYIIYSIYLSTPSLKMKKKKKSGNLGKRCTKVFRMPGCRQKKRICRTAVRRLQWGFFLTQIPRSIATLYCFDFRFTLYFGTFMALAVLFSTLA